MTGISVGFIYLLFAVGFNLAFGVLRVLNVAHAAAFTSAALMACFVSNLPIPGSLMLPALVLASLGVAIIVNLATQFLAIEPLLRRNTARVNLEMASFLTTLGIFFVVESALLHLTNAQPLSFNPEVLPVDSLMIGTDTFPIKYFLVGAAALVSVTILILVLRTKFGRFMRATSDHRQLAGVIGINVKATQRLAMIAAGALAGLAGLFVAYLYGQASFSLGPNFLLKAIVIGIVGGLGSMAGAVVVAVSLGIIEAATVTYFGGAWQDIGAFALIIVVLALRPEGLFSKKARAQT